MSDADQRLTRRIDEPHLNHPFAGSRMLRDMLNREGCEVGRKHVATLMAGIGIEALYKKPNTSRKHPGHTVYPYLLRGLTIERANHVWGMDITTIPMARGWVYLAAVVDWASRRVLAHRMSISMDVSFCMAALEEAFARHGQPGIFNTDQGSQPAFNRSSQHLQPKELQWEQQCMAAVGARCVQRSVRSGGRIGRWTRRPPTSSTSRRCRRSNRQHER